MQTMFTMLSVAIGRFGNWFGSKRRLLHVLGLAGIVVACVGAAVWFFWLVPSRARGNAEWHEKFSKLYWWTAIQHSIRRYGWRHDDSFVVGHYGDKEWAVWIMDRALAGENIALCCDTGHKDEAMKIITCHTPADADRSSAGWNAWWQTHKDMSQVEWIQSGLLEQGVSVKLPAAGRDVEALLGLLARPGSDPSGPLPNHVRYNAFRCLRDSGFEAMPYALSMVNAQTSKQIKTGLEIYAKMDAIFPRSDGLGILDIPTAGPVED